MVWHFTRLEYLREIASAGRLLCDEDVSPRAGSVANSDVKARRRTRIVNAPDYPSGRSVASHVPWYIAAKSPMLYVVTRNHPDAVLDRLVFLGMRLGDLEASGLDWVASDSNAATALAQFSNELDRLGDFVDFDLLSAQFWNNTTDDPDRMSRRAAEVLVYGHVPLDLVSVVVARNEATLEDARKLLADAGYSHLRFKQSEAFSY
ncbi:DUF4433 domain-containing protein [Agromyces sp. C10]|uniref:DUF4433 domain-containing protein n=1 Tax=Agromyces sp. C10 TaxID=2935077 RepID=UPI00200A2F55|nr:DUF4433 domain-containing protein [Agromyces sp. C10]MCK8608520.1 DUF4433 domain-containing protein [Agromyces sp. C10]